GSPLATGDPSDRDHHLADDASQLRTSRRVFTSSAAARARPSSSPATSGGITRRPLRERTLSAADSRCLRAARSAVQACGLRPASHIVAVRSSADSARRKRRSRSGARRPRLGAAACIAPASSSIRQTTPSIVCAGGQPDGRVVPGVDEVVTVVLVLVVGDTDPVVVVVVLAGSGLLVAGDLLLVVHAAGGELI